MELIKIFTGILLFICLFSCISTKNINNFVKETENELITQRKSIFGLTIQDFKGRVRVEDVSDYSPARYAGIEEGDKILEVEGVKVTDTKSFIEQIEELNNKESIKLTIYRVDSCSKFPVEIINSYN